MKKNILYLLLLALFMGFLIIIELPSSSYGSPNMLKTYTLGYFTILSGPLSVWFFSFYKDILLQVIATSIGISMITLWFYMVKKEYAFWKIFIFLSVWVLFGGLALFGEIISHC